ncbi:Transposase [Pseudomonas syringae pv. syringae HS191]|nr:Transposase [Pseudomonas syringae pv. syringae HS191]
MVAASAQNRALPDNELDAFVDNLARRIASFDKPALAEAKAHIGAESGLVHSVVVTAANVADVTQVAKLLHGKENVVCADAGCTGVEKREQHAGRKVIWQIAARRSTYKKHGKRSALYKAIRKIEKAKAQVRAKVEHPFRVIKHQFGYEKVRFRGLAKNTAQMVTLFALSNLWMAHRYLLANAGEVRA